MKRLALLTLTAVLLAPTPRARAADDGIAIAVEGRVRPVAASYRADGRLYIDAKSVGGMYDGEVYWYPVSGRVQLSVRGRTLQFVVGANGASAGAETFSLPAPVIVRASRAFIPLDFLSSEAFERWSGYDARYDATSRTLQVDRRTTAGPVHAFSYEDRTRIAVELGPGVSARAEARGVGAVEIIVPGGVVDGDQRVDVGDGIVDWYSIRQEPRLARVTVKFASDGERWRSSFLADPRRFVVDAYASGVAPGSAAPAASDEDSAPERPSAPPPAP
ncbi:MAG: copper amine oxidase N-terminal domain-containing protein, partial [Elusimicrobia bacterium]|nr:copper amine oxidase N-terminal domain-containing protein [Elusimicrobiota bacterium]